MSGISFDCNTIKKKFKKREEAKEWARVLEEE